MAKRSRPARRPASPPARRVTRAHRVRPGDADDAPGRGAYASSHARRSLSGLEVFERYVAGEWPAPPLVRLLGFRMVAVEKGRIVFAADPLETFYNGSGVIHGGWSAALLDSALGCAVNTVMPAGRVFTTLELKVNLTRPITSEVGEVRCEARVVHVGSRTATAEGRIVDARGKLYAHGTTTCILVEPPQPR